MKDLETSIYVPIYKRTDAYQPSMKQHFNLISINFILQAHKFIKQLGSTFLQTIFPEINTFLQSENGTMLSSMSSLKINVSRSIFLEYIHQKVYGIYFY